jgi:S1-C subfamily serine protease
VSESVESHNEIDTANVRLAQTVALAKVHLEHDEYEQAEKLLQQALVDPVATDKHAAIALLDEVKSAKRITPKENEQQPPALPKAAPAPANEERADPPDAAKPKQPSAVASEAVEAPVPSQAEIDKPRKPAAKPPSMDQLVSELERKARRADSAKEALALYDEFIGRAELTEKQSDRVDSRRKIWKERADEGLVRLGPKWVTEKDAEAAAKEADMLISRAWELIRVRNYREAGKLFRQASAIDQNGIRADFVLGLLNSLPYTSYNSPKLAEKHFRAVLARVPDHIAALNNLALAEVKLRKIPSALNHWRKTVELSPKTPEITQNIGRVISEASIGKLPTSRTELTKFSRLYSETIVSGKGHPSDPKTGWLYMPLILPKKERKREQAVGRKNGAGQLIALSSGTGFVFHKNYLLTNRHVVEDKTYGLPDEIRVVDPADPMHERELKAKVVALSDELDLAILQCEQLEAPSLQLATEPPRRATDVLVVGFPMGDRFGRNVKSTRGIISALPDPSNGNFLIYDATTNPGNSGGPVCDSRGSVVAVHSIGINFAGKLAGGISTMHVLPFIKQNLPNLEVGNAPGPKLEWPQVDEKVSKSTVMLITYYKAIDDGLATAANRTKEQGHYLEDRSCTACNGSGHLPCPGKKCVKGLVGVKVPYRVVEGVGVGRIVLTKYRIVKQRCSVCNGNGRIRCRFGR